MTHVTAPELPARDLRGVTMVFFAGVLWSTVGLGIRLMDEAVVWQILFYRSLSLSVLLYVVIRLRTGQDPFLLARRTGLAGVVGGLSLVAAYTGGIHAVQTTSVANAMLLFATAPFMAAILGRMVLRESVRPATWVAIAVACVGIAVMVWDKFGAPSALEGNLSALGSAFGFAVFTVALRWGKKGEMMPAVFLSGLFAVPIMGVICLLLGLPLVIGAQDAGLSLGMGVFQVGAGLILYTIGSKTVPAVELTLLSLAEVVLGPLWVWLFLGETATPYTLAGGAILLGAIAGNAISGARRKPPPPMV
jgi:drug/metabolite transporter (DMT)-like permease